MGQKDRPEETRGQRGWEGGGSQDGRGRGLSPRVGWPELDLRGREGEARRR